MSDMIRQRLDTNGINEESNHVSYRNDGSSRHRVPIGNWFAQLNGDTVHVYDTATNDPVVSIARAPDGPVEWHGASKVLGAGLRRHVLDNVQDVTPDQWWR
ncbi:hypothetical protein [Haloglycomyces albus]|uniref:hypothetical protein n=1 Tax=Haloglycomyces albus TaxID=526067 RepID=UPI0012EC53D2|nr:hypothetical protein [Haloglycomyces albus]